MIPVDEIKKKTKDFFLTYLINKESLFGSFAKGEQTDSCDIDLICEDDLSDVFRLLIKGNEVLIYEKPR